MADPRIKEIEADIQKFEAEFDQVNEKADGVHDSILKSTAEYNKIGGQLDGLEDELDDLEDRLDELSLLIKGAQSEIKYLVQNKYGGGNVEMDGRHRHLQAIEELNLKIGGGIEDPEELEMAMDELDGMHYALKLHDQSTLQDQSALRHDKQHGGSRKSSVGASKIGAQVALAITLVTLSFLG